MGRLIPLVVLAGLLTDAGLHLLPIDRFAFHAWETMVLHPAPAGPFAARKRVENDYAYGDLASLGNRRDVREYHREVFSTDEWGFRNPPGMSGAAAILDGDSYAAGSGLRDEETLSAQLAARAGQPVYNAAGTHAARVPDLQIVAKRMRLGPGVVIYTFLERTRFPEDKDAVTPEYPPRSVGRWAALRRDLDVSRLAIVARWLDQAVHFRSPDRRVVSHRLKNGREMLFLRDEIESSTRPRGLGAEYCARLAAGLAPDGLKLLVVLIPNKYTVYAPLLSDGDLPKPVDANLGDLERRLRDANIAVVNLTPFFRARAVEEFARDRYLYWVDDTHWNGRGVALAADVILPAWQAIDRAPSTSRDR